MAIKPVRRKSWKRPRPQSGASMPTFRKYEYLDCRAGLRHAWDSDGTLELTGRSAGWRQYAHCLRCGTRREVDVASNGKVLNTKYSYPEGYKLPQLSARDKRMMRLAQVKKDMARPTRHLRAAR